MQTVENEPFAEGNSRTFKANYKDVLKAARESIADVGLTFVTEKPAGKGMMLLAERGMTAFSWGEDVRIIVEPKNSSVRVQIISERALATNITAKDFTDDLFSEIQQRLDE